MSKHGALRDLVEWTLIRPVLKTLENLPLPLARFESWCLARLLRWATPGLARVARRNLSFALADLSNSQREVILHGVYRTLTRSLLCFARFPRLSRSNISGWIGYDGYEHFEAALEIGRASCRERV